MTGVAPRRRRKRLSRELKVFVSPEMFAMLVVEAQKREWSVPHLVRWAIEQGRRRR